MNVLASILRSTRGKAVTVLFIASSTTLLAQLPTSIVQSELERFERDKKAALQPVIAAHEKRLTDLQASLTKAGRLDEALAAREAIARLKTDRGQGAELLPGSVWSRGSGPGTVKLLQSGLAVSGDGMWEARGLVTRWEHKGGQVVLLTIEKGRSDKLCEVWIFDPTWTAFSGYDFDGLPVEGKLLR